MVETGDREQTALDRAEHARQFDALSSQDFGCGLEAHGYSRTP